MEAEFNRKSVGEEWDVFYADLTKGGKLRVFSELRRRIGGEPPIPPPELVEMVIGVRDQERFLKTGEETAGIIRSVLKQNAISLKQVDPVLDFGCGVGRVIRHLRKDGIELHGTDYNPRLISWCQNNLPFASFEVNPLEGPLRYPDRRFSFVYCWSVFTHLTERQGLYWMREIRRVLKPGGLLFFTTSGEPYLANYWQAYRRHLEGTGQHEYLREIFKKYGEEKLRHHTPLTGEQTERFQNGQMVVVAEERAGENACAAFHPESYVKGTLTNGFEILDFLPGGAGGESFQDAYLFSKKR